MVVNIPTADLPKLLSWLQQYLPHSFKICGELQCHLRGKFPDLAFFVDRWPDPQAVLAVTDPASTGEQLACRDLYLTMVHGIFGVNDEAVRKLLRDPAIVDWNKHYFFRGMPDTLRPVMLMMADEMGKSTKFVTTFLLKAIPQDLKPITIPEGLKTRPISSADIEIINSTWKFICEGSAGYIKELVSRQPSLFLETENGRHVGHMIGQSWGTMGMLYIQPEFRRKGYGKLVVSQLAQKYFDCGADAYVVIEDDNSPSLNLHLSVGFRVVPGVKLEWMWCSPKNACD